MKERRGGGKEKGRLEKERKKEGKEEGNLCVLSHTLWGGSLSLFKHFFPLCLSKLLYKNPFQVIVLTFFPLFLLGLVFEVWRVWLSCAQGSLLTNGWEGLYEVQTIYINKTI